jgi:predicted RNase H-like HicB family nuclease
LTTSKTGTTYTVLVYEAEDDESGYWATVAELPGCTTSGDTLDEIEANIKDAIETYMEALAIIGKPLPQPVVRKLEVAIQ